MAQFGSGCLLLPGTGTHTTLLLTSPITATSFFPFGERIFYKRIYNPTERVDKRQKLKDEEEEEIGRTHICKKEEDEKKRKRRKKQRHFLFRSFCVF
jgi:hypothetical protein